MTIESDAARLHDFAECMVALHHDLHRHPAIRALRLRLRDGCHQGSSRGQVDARSTVWQTSASNIPIGFAI